MHFSRVAHSTTELKRKRVWCVAERRELLPYERLFEALTCSRGLTADSALRNTTSDDGELHRDDGIDGARRVHDVLAGAQCIDDELRRWLHEWRSVCSWFHHRCNLGRGDAVERVDMQPVYAVFFGRTGTSGTRSDEPAEPCGGVV